MYLIQLTRAWIPAAALLCLLAPGQAQAQAEVLVIPLGVDKAIGPTAKVAEALVERLNKLAGRKQAAIYYPAPLLPAPDKKLQRKAKKLASQTRRAFERMQYEKVSSLATKLLGVEKKLMKSGRGSQGYTQALYYLAAVAQAESKVKQAFKTMNDAVLNEGLPLNKELFNPEVQRLHQRVSAERAPNGSVNLSSTPPALIWFNDRLHGLASGEVSLPSGLYLVKVYAPGHILRQRWFRVHPHRSRDLVTTLNEDLSPEAEIVTLLRQELDGDKPGQTLSQVGLELSTTQILLVNGGDACTEAACDVVVGWVKGDSWHKKKTLKFSGDADATAVALLPKKTKAKAKVVAKSAAQKGKRKVKLTVATCITDSQCGRSERCDNGRCAKYTPITKKWWFWTIIGVAAAGAAVGLAVPLASPKTPVIEVK